MRERMVEVVERETAETESWTGAAKLGERVLQAMREVPRHEFVPDDYHREAYDNRPLPIGHGQTISQPFIVAIMTELLKPQEGDVVLEVGTGSGYQAAILSRLVSLGFTNVEVRVGDGYYGWQEHAPYDGIIVTAAAGSVPPALIDQLKPGGRMVIPVGSPFLTQQLVLIEKDDAGEIKTRQLLPVAFVPLTGSH